MNRVAIRVGKEACSAGCGLPRHLHPSGYIAVVVAGDYLEAGDEGRFRVGPGDVLFHDAYDAHLDWFGARGATVLNLPLAGGGVPFARGVVDDLDQVVRLARNEPAAAADWVLAAARPGGGAEDDWPDLLAAALRADPGLGIGDWARRRHLAAASASRGFAQVYGIPPSRYALHARARHAWRAITRSRGSLAQIAAEAGFSDQPHMTRAVARLTGATPGWWRRQIRSRPS